MTTLRLAAGLLPALMLAISCAASSGNDRDTDQETDTDTETDTNMDVYVDTNPGNSDADTDTDTDTDTSDQPGVGVCKLDVIVSVDITMLDNEDEGDYGRHLVEALRFKLETFFADLLSAGPDGIVDIRVAVLDGCPVNAAFHTFGDENNCDMMPGMSWVESSDPDFEDRLGCTMTFEPYGILDDCQDDEERRQQGHAAGEALNSTSGAGFLRDNAMLLLIAQTTRDDMEYVDATAYGIQGSLVNLKNNEDENIFVIALGGEEEINILDEDCDTAYGSQGYDIKHTENLMSLASEFGDNGIFETMCHNFGDSDPIQTALGNMKTLLETRCEEILEGAVE